MASAARRGRFYRSGGPWPAVRSSGGVRLEPSSDLTLLLAVVPPPPRCLIPPPPPALEGALLGGRDRCHTRDLFCPVTPDPKAPIPFNAYLEKQNRERPDFTLAAGPGPVDCPPCPPRDEAGQDRLPKGAAGLDPLGDAAGPLDGEDGGADGSGPPRLGDVSPVPREVREVEVSVHYEIHRPIPSGMTLDVFA